MPDVIINGKPATVPTGATAAVAILTSGASAFRLSVTGEPRGPLCAMGICYECRVIINGQAHARSCQIVCRDGMVIETP